MIMKTGTGPVHRVELHLRELAPLFNPADGSPQNQDRVPTPDYFRRSGFVVTLE